MDFDKLNFMLLRLLQDCSPCRLESNKDPIIFTVYGPKHAAQRPIFRTMDSVSDVVKATDCAPKRIFVEMARGGAQEQKDKRTQPQANVPTRGIPST